MDTRDPRRQTERYCPQLGHHIPLDYCLSPGSPLPCPALRSCWRNPPGIDPEEILSRILSEDQRKEYDESQGIPKISSVFAALKQAEKKRE